jgi:glutamate/tyrosine decarboxylase-like PLP-dependent enzyme
LTARQRSWAAAATIIRTVKDDLGGWGLRRLVWVADRGFVSRAFPVWAALRSLGRTGAAALVERSCAQARRFAEILAADDEISVLNDVVLNQVLVRVGDDDERTRTVAAAIQAGTPGSAPRCAGQGRPTHQRLGPRHRRHGRHRDRRSDPACGP